MDMSNNGLLRLFCAINADKNHYITTEELKKAEASHVINKEEQQTLEKTFTLNKCGLGISLDTYMKGMNYYRQQLGITDVFSEDNLKWADRTFVLNEVRKNGLMLSRTNMVMKNDREVVMTAVHSSGLALMYAGSDLKNAPDIARTAIENNGGAWRYIGPSLRAMKDLAFLALKDRPETIKDIAPHFLHDQAFWEELVLRIDWKFIAHLPKGLRQDPHFTRSLVERMDWKSSDINDISLFPEEMAQDQKTVEIIAENITWREIVFNNGNNLSDRTSLLTEKVFAIHKPVVDALAMFDIHHPERFRNIQEARHILRNRQLTGPIDRSKKVAVLTFATKDNKRSFEVNPITELVDKEYVVLYYEIADEELLYKVVRDSAARGKISLLFIAGHGSPTSVDLDTRDDTGHELTEKRELDPTDKKEINTLNSALKGSVIVLDSCLTGKGKDKEQNMVRLFRSALPDARKIIGPTDTTREIRFSYSPDGDIDDALYMNSKNQNIESFSL